MPRPRKHDEHTRAAIVAAAERAIAEGGPSGLSMRRVADDVGTTTWAIYSLFDSRDGLLGAVAQHAIEILEIGLLELPVTEDPAADLVEAGAGMYRRFVLEHPWPFRLAFQRIVPDLHLGEVFFEARARCWDVLERRVARLDEVGLLGPRTVREATVEFNAMCEGLANAELRGGTLAPGDQERIWRDAFTVLIRGFAAPAPPARRARSRPARPRTASAVTRRGRRPV